MDIQDVIRIIMEERKCSPIYALYVFLDMQEQLRKEENECG